MHVISDDETMNEMTTVDGSKWKLTPSIHFSTTWTILALVCTFLATPLSLAQDQRPCRTFPRILDAQQTIRDYRPGDNSIGLKEAVEKIICETDELTNVTLDQAILSGIDASNATFVNCSFVGTNLSEAILDGATFERGTLAEANLQKSSAVGAIFRGTNMDGTYWDCADFTATQFIDVHWRNVSGQASIMREMQFYRYGWENVNLALADLRDVQIFGYANRGSTIARANVSGTDMRIFSDLFRGQLDQIFGSYGACYVEDSPPVDSEFDNWTVQDGAMWRGVRLNLSICGEQTVSRTECEDEE